MSFIGKAIGSITGASSAAKAAERAGATQAAAAQTGIEEQRRAQEQIRALLQPFVTAGTGALGAQQGLIGLGGPQAQQEAIAGLQASPEFQALTQQGENALLQQASATGGLRGGNIQGALAQFRPQLLSQLINQQYSRLGGLSALGQASAAGVGGAGQTAAGNIANLLAQQGAATAGGQIARGNVAQQGFGQGLQIAGSLLGAFGGFGGGGAAAAAPTAAIGPTTLGPVSYSLGGGGSGLGLKF